MNNDTEILIKRALYRQALNLSGLDRTIPFCFHPEFKKDTNYLEINYSLGEDVENVLKNSLNHKSENYVWLIFPSLNIHFRFRDIATSSFRVYPVDCIEERWEVPQIYLHDAAIPYHICKFRDYVKAKYKTSYIQILDYLPGFFSVRVTTKFNLKDRKVAEVTLLEIADYINRKNKGKETIDKINKISKNAKKSFRERLDEIIGLSESNMSRDYSYCLACGKSIDYGKKFCNASIDGYGNKDNCLNKFNYWLKARLRVVSVEEKANLRNRYFAELQDLIEEHPLTAFDKFRLANKKLFEKGYKERWRRERLTKNPRRI